MVNIKELYIKAREERLSGRALNKNEYELENFVPVEDKIEEMSSVDLIRNEGAKVSMLETMKSLQEYNPELFYYIAFTAAYPRRAALCNSPRGCSLVPLFMSAHKEYDDISYSEWDKEDKAIHFAVGFSLWDDIKPFLNFIPGLDDNLATIRKRNTVDNKGNNKKLTGYSFSAMKYNKGKSIPGSSLAMKIKGQFWNANVAKRNEYMILDTVDWDNVPEAFDIKMDSVIASEDPDFFMFD